jgi:hypothetical protein
VCKQCTQVCSRRTRNKYKQKGTLPNCKAHGVHAVKGHAEIVDALQGEGYSGIIKLETAHHSHGVRSHIGGRFSRKHAYRADVLVSQGDGCEVVIEVDGAEHARAEVQKRDGERDGRIGLPTLRVGSQYGLDITALKEFVLGAR